MSKTAIAIWVVLVLAVIATTFAVANRPRRVIIDADLPVDFPQQGFSHDSFEELMQTYVSAEGRVDYERWQQFPESREQLRSYLSAVSRYSPNSTPERFASRNDELAYWLYGYNAYVINSVLDHWPIKSVTDVKAPIEAITGLGFFYQQRFSFGGEFMSLRGVENNEIRSKYKDPRIHFVLNCASESCPIARPELPVGDDLEKLLQRATDEFVNNSANVQVDHEAKTIYLSTIFKWYENDFVHSVRLQGKPVGSGLIAYIEQNAAGDLAVDLAQSRGYEIRFRDYDWDLNSTH